MLELLHIENIAIIEAADIEFAPGFNALTGETGAGKSIVIDSLSAVLGQRTSRELIRTGAEKAFVSAAFSGMAPELTEELGHPAGGGWDAAAAAGDPDRRQKRMPGQRPSGNSGTAAGTGCPTAEYPRAARRAAAAGRGAAHCVSGQLWQGGKSCNYIC